MIRYLIIDFNHKGIARHEVHILGDNADDPEELPNKILKNYKMMGSKDFELVGITEIAGRVFKSPKELEKAATQPPEDDMLLISWYHDVPAGLKTISQEPADRIEQFINIFNRR